MSVYGWLYLIQLDDHRKNHELIYKIGRTNDVNRRINEIPAYSQIISACPVDNDKKCERELIKNFKNEFEFRNDIGHEYLQGDEREMISVFNDYVSDHLPDTREEVDMDYHWNFEDQRIKTERNQMVYKNKRYKISIDFKKPRFTINDIQK
jgi:hypothetical protein